MNSLIHSFFSEAQILKPGAFTASIRTRAATSQDNILKGLEMISKALPYLKNLAVDEKEKKYQLKNDAEDAEKQVLLTVSDLTSFQLAWGPEAALDCENSLKIFFDIVQDIFGVTNINVGYIDFEFYAVTYRSGHHYAAINEAFYRDDTIGQLLNRTDFLQNDIYLLAQIDSDRRCRISIDSNLKDKEIVTGKFKNDFLRARVGIGYIGSINTDTRLSNLICEHMKIAIEFINKKFVPSVIIPLEQALAQIVVPMEEKNG